MLLMDTIECIPLLEYMYSDYTAIHPLDVSKLPQQASYIMHISFSYG